MTTIKLKIQLADVARALAGALIVTGVISGGNNQGIFNQPTPKKVLKTNDTAAAIPGPPCPMKEVVITNTTIDRDCPTALVKSEPDQLKKAWKCKDGFRQNNMRFLRPNFAMIKTAIQEAAKYSVPLQAAT